MQVTGWGLTEPPEYDKNYYRLNDPKKSRYLKVAYVRDHTKKKRLPGEPFCDFEEVRQTQMICVYNLTLVLNRDFCQFRRV